MLLLSGEILQRIKKGSIVIKPFNEKQLNPNSYNLRLGPDLLMADVDTRLDLKEDPKDKFKRIRIGDKDTSGYELQPGHLYLGSTVEWTETYDTIPCIEGRSSIARFGIECHISAGFGDLEYKGRWTLELTCVVPVRIYSGIEICQIRYDLPYGTCVQPYEGKYQNAEDILTSRFHSEFAEFE